MEIANTVLTTSGGGARGNFEVENDNEDRLWTETIMVDQLVAQELVEAIFHVSGAWWYVTRPLPVPWRVLLC